MSESKWYWTFRDSKSVTGSISQNWFYTKLVSSRDLPIFPTKLLHTNCHLMTQYHTLLPHPVLDYTLQMALHKWSLIWDCMVYTAMDVAGVETVTNHVLMQVQMDLWASPLCAMATDLPWGWTEWMPYNQNSALQVAWHHKTAHSWRLMGLLV